MPAAAAPGNLAVVDRDITTWVIVVIRPVRGRALPGAARRYEICRRSGRSVRRWPIGRADHAGQSLLEQPRKLPLLALVEPAEVELTHRRVMDALSTTQYAEPLAGQPGQGRPPVLRVGLTADQPALLEPHHRPGDTARRQHPPDTELAHAKAHPGPAHERDQEPVVVEGDLPGLPESSIDLAHHRLAQANQTAPCVELSVGERIRLREIT